MSSRISPWFDRHSIALYFILTYVISWLIWSPIVLSARGVIDWDVPYSLYYIGSFGPMVAALIMTAIIHDRWRGAITVNPKRARLNDRFARRGFSTNTA